MRQMRGFTLLEVMMALTIFTLGLLSITGMFGTALQSLSSSEGRTRAILLAQEKMEELKSLPDAALVLISASAFQEDRGSIHLAWTLQRDRPVRGLHTLTVKALWQVSGGPTRSVEFVTLRTDLAYGEDEGGL